MRRLDPDELFSKVKKGDIESYVYAFAPIEPYTANPIVREMAGLHGAHLVFRPKINPFHLLRSKIWQEYERIPDIEQKYTFSGREFYDGFQLMARHDDPIKDSVRFISKNKKKLGIQFIDLNFSCPGYNVLPHNRGGALLTQPRKMRIVIEKTLKYSAIPVSVKIRNGFSSKSNCREVCRILNDYDLAWITINRAPVKREHVDFEALKDDYTAFHIAASENMNMPVIANGDLDMKTRTLPLRKIPNCKGIMIARGALGNPSLFQKLQLPKSENGELKDHQKRDIEGELKKLFRLVKKYDKIRSQEGRRLWTSFGQLKRVIFFFIKHYYESRGELIPAGYGETSFIRQTKFTRHQFVKVLSRLFPMTTAEQWEYWIPNYPK